MNLHAIYLPLSSKYGAYHFLFPGGQTGELNGDTVGNPSSAKALDQK